MPAVTLTCDNCDRPFTIESPEPGAKVACPRCGDINVYRPAAATGAAGPAMGAAAGPSAAHPTDRALAMGLPAATGPEQTVRLVPGAMFRSRPIGATVVSLGLLAGALGAAYLGYTGKHTWSIVFAAIAGVFFVIILGWKLQAFSERLTITTKRVVMTRGILSKSTIECLHRTIQEIQIEQSFWQRVLGIGKITISNASEGGQTIIVPAAPDPYGLRKIIDAYRPM